MYEFVSSLLDHFLLGFASAKMSDSNSLRLVYRASFQLDKKLLVISIVFLVTFCVGSAEQQPKTVKCDPKTSCPNGRCAEDHQGCLCDSCWSGERCQQFGEFLIFC